VDGSAEKSQAEEILRGGNTTVVVRVGDTVRRHTGHWTPAVHALLAHLSSVGFGDAPTVLGIDDQGREILPFLVGEVGTFEQGHLLSPWFRTAEACMAIGDWLRRFHDAQRGFTPDPALPWRIVPGRALTAGEVVVHHDAAPYNTIRRPDGGLTVIDWDFCAPGDPVEDLAFSAWQWIPLWANNAAVSAGNDEAGTVPHAATRVAALADGYDASPDQRSRLLGMCVRQMAKHADDVEAMAVYDPAFARLVEMGVPGNARLDAAWVSDNEVALSVALRVVA
jgi:Ser/Thr protein kinase RdoA (MazF antagonist)